MRLWIVDELAGEPDHYDAIAQDVLRPSPDDPQPKVVFAADTDVMVTFFILRDPGGTARALDLLAIESITDI